MALSEQANLLVRISAQNAAGAVLGQVGQQFGQLQGTVTRVAAAIGSAFAIRNVIDTTRQFTHDLDALADAMGASGAEASKWNYQARYVGATADDLASSFQILANNVYSQAEAIGKGTSDFDKLGIGVLNAAGQMRPMADIIEDLRNKMRGLDAPSQAIIERQLFGRAGGRLHDFLTLADQDITRLTGDLDAFGGLLDSDVVAAMEEQQRQFNRLGFLFDLIKLQLGQALIPMFLRLADAIVRPQGPLKAIIDIGARFLQFVKEAADKFGIFLQQLKEGGLGGALSALWDGLKKVGQSLKDDLVGLLEKMGVPAGIARVAIEGISLAIQGLAGTWIVSRILGLVAALGGLAVKAGFLAAAAVIFNDLADTLQRVGTTGGSASDALGLFAGAIGLVGLAMNRNPLMLVVSAIAEVASTVALVMENWDKFKFALMNDKLGDIPIFGGLFSAIKNAVNLMADLRGKWDEFWAHINGSAAPGGGPKNRNGFGPDQPSTTSADVVDLFLQYLGRMPRPEEIYGRLGQGLLDVAREIADSLEAGLYKISQGTLAPSGGAIQGFVEGGAGIQLPDAYQAGGGRTGRLSAAEIAAINLAYNTSPQGMAFNAYLGRLLETEGTPARLAAGGLVTRPTRAIVGESGPEAVVPLDRVGSFGGGLVNNFYIGSVDSRERVRELARAVSDEIMRATRGQRNFSLA